jgi:hypothetical protein
LTLWPTSVELAGASIPLADVLADLTIHHGLADIGADPTATTCQITLAGMTNADVMAFEVGQRLAIMVADGPAPPEPRFTGYVTEATLAVDQLTIIAAGEVSRLRLYVVGEVDWPAEAWSARVTRIFTEAGMADRLELQPDPGFNPQIAARVFATAGATTLGDYLAFLAGMVGAAVTDRPNGDIRVQAIGARTVDAAVALDPADVEYSPAWRAELPRGNIVTVRYQADQGESVTVTDAASVALYGERPETIDTAFSLAADATTRANQRLARAAYSHWNIPEAPIVRGLVLDLGAPLELSAMPDASPADPWTPILEGWTDELTGDVWRMTLSLSDPLLSGAILPWVAVPTVDHWNTIDPATDWTEALTLDDLELN